MNADDMAKRIDDIYDDSPMTAEDSAAYERVLKVPRYWTFKDAKIVRTIPSPDGGVNVDVAADGSIVGVEVL